MWQERLSEQIYQLTAQIAIDAKIHGGQLSVTADG
jgi:hypothetical protein